MAMSPLKVRKSNSHLVFLEEDVLENNEIHDALEVCYSKAKDL